MSHITSKQCACRWVYRHQHKLMKQVARACSLKVKEIFSHAEPQIEPIDIPDMPYSFQARDLEITVADRDHLKMKPSESGLKFGHVFTDHMLKILYNNKLGGWQKPVIIPFENISLHPAAKVLHYAVELFEGMKAYRGVDGKVRMFRPELNMARMNASAQSAGLPTFDGGEFVKCLQKLLQVDHEWVPRNEMSSLYIRPTLIGIDGTLGVYQSHSALLYTILCPVGSYFGGLDDPISLYADPSYTRAWPGGCGDKKMGSNYGPTIRVQNRASRRGRQQVLWLYGPDHQITEVGTMNIFVYYINKRGEKVLATPPLNGLILPGVTRHSIIELSEQWREFRVEERSVTMHDIIHLKETGRLLEMFGSGTACVISPISSVEYMGDLVNVPTQEHADPVYKRIRDTLLAIQYGHISHPWARCIDDA